MKVVPNQLFHLQILNAAEKYNNQIALVDGKTRESITFGQFRKRAFQFATVLSAHMFPSSGNNIRDTVLVVMPNTISYPFVFCGSALLGNPICGINPSATKEELQNSAMKCGAQYIVCTAELLEDLLEAFDGTKMPIFVFGKHILSPHRSQPTQEIIDLNSEMEIAPFDEELVETLSARSRALVTIDDVLLAPLSSGTLGEPKCVQLTHKNFNAATIALKELVFCESKWAGGLSGCVGE
uniref:AMP-dependent synthetase/ligase domain-containing protein n=1 Tax=Panagrolaimus davidi TaxID=227884 RepID=A0A914QPW9_9BILA